MTVWECGAGYPLPEDDGPCPRCGATADETCKWAEFENDKPEESEVDG